MLRDELILVDINDNEIGTSKKMEAHVTPKLHRAFSIFLYNDKKEMLIQKRALNKYHSGGLWSNTCCSHPRKGEGLIESAKDRLLDEMGIDCELKELYSFTYMNKFNDNLYEYEYDHVIVGRYNGDYTLNKEEACDAKWIGLDELKEDLKKNPRNYSSWFIICAPKVIEYIESNQ